MTSSLFSHFNYSSLGFLHWLFVFHGRFGSRNLFFFVLAVWKKSRSGVTKHEAGEKSSNSLTSKLALVFGRFHLEDVGDYGIDLHVSDESCKEELLQNIRLETSQWAQEKKKILEPIGIGARAVGDGDVVIILIALLIFAAAAAVIL